MSSFQLKKGLQYNFSVLSLLLKAHFRSQRFYCRALAGESNYNICINSDLSVSCNCQDFDGSGHIGDLHNETLDQIFHGDKANNLRTALSNGSFPLSACPVCPELSLVAIDTISALLASCHVPHRGIMVENTAACNLQCPLCRRKELLGIRKKTSLELPDVAKVASVLNDYGIESVYYFNLGEPFLPNDIYNQIKTLREKNPNIRIITSTNGMLLESEEKLEAALLMDYIFISLDGVTQEMVSRYQVGGNFMKIYENMARLAARAAQKSKTAEAEIRTPIIEWRYILFRWNDAPAHIDRAIQLAKEAGVDLIVFSPGSARFMDRSYRFRFHPYFTKLGKKKPSGEIVVNLSGVPDHLVSP